MIRLLPISLLLVIVCAVLASGCGGPKQVTYVDPNGASPYVNPDGDAPVTEFGAAAVERAKAAARVRGALATARVLAGADERGATGVISRSIELDLPLLEGRASRTNEQAALELRGDLEALRDDPPAPDAWARSIRTGATRSLATVEQLVVPAAARQDEGFRAIIVHEVLLQAAAAYEAALTAEGEPDIAEFRSAYGLLTVVSTQLLATLPQQAQGAVRSSVTKLLRRALPGPTPRDHAPDAASVASELATVADRIVEVAHVDPTYPDPDAGTPDQLRSLKRAVAAIVESGARGSGPADVQTQITNADTHLAAVADSLAIIDPELLAALEHGLLITLPNELEGSGDASAVAADLDAMLDEAISLVEEELELLRS